MIRRLFTWLLSGGIGYLQGATIVGLGGVILWFYADYKFTKADNRELKNEVFWQDFTIGVQASVNHSLATSSERREQAAEAQQTIEGTINAQPQSNECARALAIIAALDGVRDRRAERARLAADQRTSIPLPERTRSSNE